MNISNRPRGDGDGVLKSPAFTDLAIPPVALFPVTRETSVNYAVTAGKLPEGLILDVLDGCARIVGVPIKAGRFSFSVTATDMAGVTDEVVLEYEIKALVYDE